MLERRSNCATKPPLAEQEDGRFESMEEPSEEIIEIALAAAPQLKESICPSNAGFGSLMAHVPGIAPVV